MPSRLATSSICPQRLQGCSIARWKGLSTPDSCRVCAYLAPGCSGIRDSQVLAGPAFLAEAVAIRQAFQASAAAMLPVAGVAGAVAMFRAVVAARLLAVAVAEAMRRAAVRRVVAGPMWFAAAEPVVAEAAIGYSHPRRPG